MNRSIEEQFRVAVAGCGGSAQAAKALGCSRAYVDMIRKGSRRPGMRVAHAIERVFGIPMQAWLGRPASAPTRESRIQ